MRFVGFFLLTTATVWAGAGISGSTFQLPNNTGVTVNDLHVVLTGPSSTVSSSTFVTNTGYPDPDFTGGSVAPGDPAQFSTFSVDNVLSGELFEGISSYYWTVDGTQTGDTESPLIPSFQYDNPSGGAFTVALTNATSAPQDFSSATLTAHGVPLAIPSGPVAPNSTLTLFHGSESGNVELMFTDSTTGASEDVSFAPSAPEPGTLSLIALALLCGAFGMRRLRRARA